jgi:hypothetical protein
VSEGEAVSCARPSPPVARSAIWLESRAQPVGSGSRPVSRVLSWTAIPLGLMSPSASSGLPGSVHGSTLPRALRLGLLPYLALLQVGFAVPPLLPGARCALTAPFHPCRRPVTGAWAVCFLLHFPWARAPQALPGTSSAGARTFLPSARSGTAAARPTPARTIRPCGGKSNVRQQIGSPGAIVGAAGRSTAPGCSRACWARSHSLRVRLIAT